MLTERFEDVSLPSVAGEKICRIKWKFYWRRTMEKDI